MALDSAESLRTADLGYERGLGVILDKLVRGHGSVLHHRRLARDESPLDHLVVTTAGVLLIEPVYAPHQVRCRHTGQLFRTTARLHVDGRDRMDEIARIRRRTEIVHALLLLVGYAEVPLLAVLAFINSDLRLSHRNRVFDGVVVADSSHLADLAIHEGRLTQANVMSIVYHLDSLLPDSVRAAA